jgi:hypothetical protein
MKLSRRRKAKLQRKKNEGAAEKRATEKAFDLNLDRIKRRDKKILANRSA